MATPLESTKSGKDALVSVSYTHDAMIDLILANPQLPQGKIASYFGYTEGWVSRVMGSDAFNARLAARKSELVDPTILATLDERLKGLAIQSMDIIQQKLEATKSPDLATKTLELTTKALGMGARVNNQVNVQQNYVVAMPVKATDENAWAEQSKVEVKKLAFPVPAAADVSDVAPKA